MKKCLLLLLASMLLVGILTVSAFAEGTDPADRAIARVYSVEKDYPFDSETPSLVMQGQDFKMLIEKFEACGAGAFQRVFPIVNGEIDFDHEGYYEDGSEDYEALPVHSQRPTSGSEESANTVTVTSSKDFKTLYVCVTVQDSDYYIDETAGEEITENVKLSVDFGGKGENVVDYVLTRGGFSGGNGKFAGNVWNADLSQYSHNGTTEAYSLFLFKIDTSDFALKAGDYLGINAVYTSVFDSNDDPTVQNVIFYDNPTHDYLNPTAWNTVYLSDFEEYTYEVTDYQGEECIRLTNCFVTGTDEVRLPETMTIMDGGVEKTLPVRILGEQFIAHNEDVKKVTVSKSIAMLDNKPFWSDYVEEIVFEDCELEGHVWNDYVDWNGNYEEVEEGGIRTWFRPFYHAIALKRVTLPSDLTELPYLCFRYCLSLEEVIFPDTITEIGYNAFYNCDALESITIPNTVKRIGGGAFYSCGVLKELILPEGIEQLGSELAYYCEQLMRVEVHGKDVELGAAAFAGAGAEKRIVYIDCGGEVQRVCDEDGYIYYCMNDAHDIGDWVTTVEATAETGDGLMTKSCKYCKYHEDKVIDWPNPFGDIKKKDWYFGAVKFVYTNNKIMQGSSGKFNPKKNMTRAEFCQALYSLDHKGATAKNETTTKFKDVPSGKWFTGAVKWANVNGIVAGTGTNDKGEQLFSPNSNITRQEICSLLARYMDYALLDMDPPTDVEFPTFSDEAKIAKWAKKDMVLMGKLGIITGSPNGDGTFLYNPAGNATRAEIAQILRSLCEKNPSILS